MVEGELLFSEDSDGTTGIIYCDHLNIKSQQSQPVKAEAAMAAVGLRINVMCNGIYTFF